MSKFKELQATAEESERKSLEYRARSYQDLNTLAAEFVKYCEIPAGCFSWWPLEKEPEPRMMYNVVGATHFSADGYWHAGFIIDLSSAENEFPRRRALFEFCVAERNGALMVKAGKKGKEWRLNLTDEIERNKFYDSVVELTKKVLSTELTDMPNGDGLRKVGFNA